MATLNINIYGGGGSSLPPVAPSESFTIDDQGWITGVDFSNSALKEITIPFEINGKTVIGFYNNVYNNRTDNFKWGNVYKITIPFDFTFRINRDDTTMFNEITSYSFGGHVSFRSEYNSNKISFSSNLNSLEFATGVVPELYLGLFQYNTSINLQDIVDDYYTNVNSIPSYCFANTSGLTNIDIFTDIANIDANAFENSNIQGNLHFTNLSVINRAAFSGTNIDSITLDSCTKISGYSFNNSKIISITLKSSIVVVLEEPDSVFRYANRFENIYVPANLVDAYKADANWSQYADKIKAIEE